MNVNEMTAAVHTVKAFEKPGETVLLNVDNKVKFILYTAPNGTTNQFEEVAEPANYF